MRLQIPVENVRVPLDQFDAVWTEAERLLRDDPSSRYLGGVCAACRWAATHPDARSPLRNEPALATAERIVREDMLAVATYRGSDHGVAGVDESWAAGVAATLGWIRGALTIPPRRRA